MNRERAIGICNKFYQESLGFEEAFNIIAEYALEKGKTQEQIVLLSKVLAINPLAFSDCLRYIIDYYRREYSLISVHIIKENQFLNPILIY